MKRKAKKARRRLAILTIEEEKTWVKYFEYYINEGNADDEADESAWKDLQQEFPRLLKYDGISKRSPES